MSQDYCFGVSQPQRLAPALGPAIPKLDPRSDSELLAMGAQFAALLAFYERDGTRAGDFERFFVADAQIFAARIATFPVATLKAELLASVQNADVDSAPFIVATLVRLWGLADRWVTDFPLASPFDGVARILRAQIAGRLVPALGLTLELGPANLLSPADFEQVRALAIGLDPTIWRGIAERTRQATSRFGDSAEPTEDAFIKFERCVALTLDAVEAMIGAARTAIEGTDWLYPRMPQVALFIAFLRQFSNFRESFNRLPARHLDFYYRRVLREREAAGIGEKTWLVVQLKESALPAPWAAGQSVQGQGSTLPRFVTVMPIGLSQARVGALMSVRTWRDKAGMSWADQRVITPSSPPVVAGGSASWPTFGGIVDTSAPPPPGAVRSDFGFIVPAACLMGIDGERTLRLRLTVDGVTTLPASPEPCLQVQISCGSQWLTGQAGEPASFSEADRILEVVVGFPSHLPIASPPSAPSPLAGLSAGDPLLKCSVSPAVETLPGWLNGLHITRIDLVLEVVGASPGKLMSVSGLVPPGGAPFGVTPEAGAYFDLSASRALALQPDELTLAFAWQSLPTQKSGFKNGFASYYAGYVANVSPAVPSIAPVPGATPAPASVPSASVSAEVSEALSTSQVSAATSTIEGIDVSHWQSTIRWHEVDRKRVAFAWIKKSEGQSATDAQFESNWLSSKSAGIPRGAYHLFKPDQSVDAQVELFLKRFEAGYDGELPPALDLERASLQTVSAQAGAQFALQWLSAISRTTGRRPVVYIGPQSMRYLGVPGPLATFPRWIAWPSSAAAPTRLGVGWEDWTFWQYGKSSAMPGISAPVDVDRFHGDQKAFQAFIGAVGPTAANSPTAHDPNWLAAAVAHEGAVIHDWFSKLVGTRSSVATVLPVAGAPMAGISGLHAQTSPPPFADASFAISASVLVDGKRSPTTLAAGADNKVFAEQVGLFVDNATQPLAEGTRSYRIRLPGPSFAAPESVRLQLVAPDYGFGRYLYASSVNAATMANAAQLVTEAVSAEGNAVKPKAVPVGSASQSMPSGPAGRVSGNSRQAIQASDAGSSEASASELTSAETVVEKTALHLGESGLARVFWWYRPVAVLVAAIRKGLALFKRAPTTADKAPPPHTQGLVIPATNPPSATLLRPIPLPPFTPTVSAINVSFTISRTLYPPTPNGPQRPATPAHRPAKLWQLGPLQGLERAHPGLDGDAAGVPLLPQAPGGNSLYITFERVQPGEVLSILWVAEPDDHRGQTAGVPLSWEYQEDGGAWVPANVTLVIGSGQDVAASPPRAPQPDLTGVSLIHLSVPADVQLNEGAKWLLRITDPSGSYRGRTFGIYVNAVLAERVVTADATDWKNFRISAGTLNTLTTPSASIAKVLQPLPGFGGRKPEDTQGMRARVSERLRHKGRALTSWDYERLALEATDGIFAARCIPATSQAPGVVTLILVPRVDTPGGGAQGFPPRLEGDHILCVQNAVAQVMPLGAKLVVRAVDYEMVHVRCTVRARAGVTPPEARSRLQSDLQNFISAWVYTPASAQSVASSAPSREGLTRFVAARDYVASVVGECELDAGSTSDIWAIPVSSAQHDITVI